MPLLPAERNPGRSWASSRWRTPAWRRTFRATCGGGERTDIVSACRSSSLAIGSAPAWCLAAWRPTIDGSAGGCYCHGVGDK
jgi:hypothetical protein